ncbi:MAG: twin-arginine translocase TatA/TatE family subunit [Litorimonas sp.]
MGAHPIGLLVIAVIAILIFGGRGKISSIMGDMGKGISSFRKGLKDGADDVKDAANDVKDAAEEAIDITPPKKGDDTKADK